MSLLDIPFDRILRWAVLGGVAYMTFKYASEVEPELLQVREINLPLPRLDPAFDGYRVVQISDIHLDTGFGQKWLDSIIATANALRPDTLAITGDFLTRRIAPYDEQLIEALSRLEARDAKVAVLGNHDHWLGANIIRDIIHSSGLTDLSNRVHTLRRGQAQFHLAGVDDIWAGKQRLDDVLDALPEDGAAMLLAHEPDFADESSQSGRFDLQISGHTHGGVIQIMGASPPSWMMVPHGRKYKIGLYRIGEMWQYTNRGVGVVVPFRLNCRPEITLFTLRAGQGQKQKFTTFTEKVWNSVPGVV